MREICTAGSDWGARHKPPLAARPQASTNHRVNHDKLMSLVARKVKDKRVLRLIRKYLEGLLALVNRRIPNGTYGGVVRTAGELITRLLPA